MLDEADAIFGKALKGDEKAEHLRGILNAGFGRDRPYKRWDITTRAVENCPTFAMAVIAGIGSMPDTIEDRAVIITLRRKTDAESVQKYRTRRDKPAVKEVGDKLAAWMTPLAAAAGKAEPDMPPGCTTGPRTCGKRCSPSPTSPEATGPPGAARRRRCSPPTPIPPPPTAPSP